MEKQQQESMDETDIYFCPICKTTCCTYMCRFFDPHVDVEGECKIITALDTIIDLDVMIG